jgi:hypothetical protein
VKRSEALTGRKLQQARRSERSELLRGGLIWLRSEMADGGEEGNASAHRGSARRRAPALDADELLALMHGSDPVKVELNRLENEVRGELELIRARSTFWFRSS